MRLLRFAAGATFRFAAALDGRRHEEPAVIAGTQRRSAAGGIRRRRSAIRIRPRRIEIRRGFEFLARRFDELARALLLLRILPDQLDVSRDRRVRAVIRNGAVVVDEVDEGGGVKNDRRDDRNRRSRSL